MEVSGRKGSLDSILLCQPCQGDGDTVQAEGYCENCNQLICSPCVKAHRKLPLTKHHEIKSKDAMPIFLATQSDPCTEFCEIHKNEIVKFYCQKHKCVGCGDCMILKHTSCKVQLVSDVSCNYDNSDEIVLIKHKIDHLKKNLDSCKREVELSLKTADEIKTSIIEEIKQFRKDIDIHLYRVTKCLIQKVEKVSAGDISRQQELQGQCKAAVEDIEKMQRKLEQCNDNVNDLFVSSKRIQNTLQRYQELNEEISSKSQINTFKFTQSEDLHALRVHNTRLGNLETQVKKFSGQCVKSIVDMKTDFVQKFNLKGKGEKDCRMTGMTIISDAEILCADNGNESLKVINHKVCKIILTLKTSSGPSDVTTINSSSAAASLPGEGKILFLNTQNELTISHSIKVRKKCWGIDHHNGIIAVVFYDPPAVQMIDMEGHILHEVKDTSIFKSPRYVCLGNGNNSMFVSDWKNNAVYEFTQQGHLKNIIKSDDMKFPAGITITNCGNVLIFCDINKSDKVGVIIHGTREIVPIYVQNILNPWCILICEEQRKLFISAHFESKDANYIKLFDLK